MPLNDPQRVSRRSARRRLPGLVACSVVAAMACDLPTAPPRFLSRYLVPIDESTIGLSQLLPAGVTVVGDTVLQLAVAGLTLQPAIEELCPACALPSSAPKPAFSATFGGTTALPAGVASASVRGGSLDLRIENRLGFDPLRPGPTAAGRLTVELRTAGASLGSVVLDGATESLVHGAVVTRSVPIAAASASTPISLLATLESPAGDAFAPPPDARLSVQLLPSVLYASDAIIDISRRTVELTPASFDLRNVDDAVARRAHEGALVLRITNPLAVSGALELRIAAPGVELRRDITIGSGTQRVPLTAAEARSLFGRVVTLSATGEVEPAAGVAVAAGDRIAVEARFEVALEIGGLP